MNWHDADNLRTRVDWQGHRNRSDPFAVSPLKVALAVGVKKGEVILGAMLCGVLSLRVQIPLATTDWQEGLLNDNRFHSALQQILHDSTTNRLQKGPICFPFDVTKIGRNQVSHAARSACS